MDDANIKKRIEFAYREKERKIKEKKEKLNIIQSSTFDERKGIKDLISVIPFTAFSVMSFVLATRGIINPSLVPFISVIGGKFVGDVIELVAFDKKNKHYYDYYKEITDATKEGEIFTYLEKLENEKSDLYVLEHMNNIILNGSSNIKDNKKNVNRKVQKENLQDDLKRINTRIILNQYYSDYFNPSFAKAKHILKTILGTAEVCALYLLLQHYSVGTLTPTSFLIPAVFGVFGYGTYNYNTFNARSKIFKKNMKRVICDNESNNLDELRKKQYKLCNKLGYIGVLEEIEKEHRINEQNENKNLIKKKDLTNTKIYNPPTIDNYYDLDITTGSYSNAKILRKKKPNEQ